MTLRIATNQLGYAIQRLTDTGWVDMTHFFPTRTLAALHLRVMPRIIGDEYRIYAALA